MAPPAAGREGGRGESSRNARAAPKVTATTVSSRVQAPPSGGWASLGPRPLKEQGRGKETRPKEPGKKLKSGFLNTYYAPARAGARPVLPLPAGTGAPAGGGRVSIKTPILSALLPKDDGLSLGRLDAVFPSFPRPLTRHLGLRSRVTHWLTNSPPDVGYWNAQPSP